MDMNDNLQNLYVSSVISLIYRHTLPEYKDWSNLNDMNMGIENSNVNGDHYYMNSSTESESKNHNFYKEKILNVYQQI